MWAIVVSKMIIVCVVVVLAEFVRRRCPLRPRVAYAAWSAVGIILLLPPLISVPLIDAVETVPSSELISTAHSSSVDAGSSTESAGAYSIHSAQPEFSPGAAGGTGESHGLSMGAVSWEAVVLLCWFVGAAILVGLHLAGARALARLVRAAQDAPFEIAQLHSSVAAELGLGMRLPKVVVANGTFSPFLWHPVLWGEARVVLPQALLDRLPRDSVGAILRHELIHFRRKDSWRRQLGLLTVVIWWWFPASWLARRRLCELGELCTDAEAIRCVPASRRAYAHALIDTEEFLSNAFEVRLSAVPTLTGGEVLRRRVQLIMAAESDARVHRFPATVLCVLFASAGLVFAGTIDSNPADPLKAIDGQVSSSDPARLPTDKTKSPWLQFQWETYLGPQVDWSKAGKPTVGHIFESYTTITVKD